MPPPAVAFRHPLTGFQFHLNTFDRPQSKTEKIGGNNEAGKGVLMESSMLPHIMCCFLRSQGIWRGNFLYSFGT